MNAGRHRVIAGFVTLAMVGISVFGAMIVVIQGGNDGFEYALLGVGAIAGLMGWLWRGPVGKALARMLEGDAGNDTALMARLIEMEDRLAELGLESQRMAELEDRLEFTERMLSAATTSREEVR